MALLKHCPWLRGGKAWEPACASGKISDVLRQYGAEVTESDIRTTPRTFGGVDFLTAPMPAGVDRIITNPPFSIAEEFILQAHALGVSFAFLLKQTYWNAANRRYLFTKTRPTECCPITWRVNFKPERGKAPVMDVMWMVWNRENPTNECGFYPLVRP